jgi:hypothetical protein
VEKRASSEALKNFSNGVSEDTKEEDIFSGSELGMTRFLESLI